MALVSPACTWAFPSLLKIRGALPPASVSWRERSGKNEGELMGAKSGPWGSERGCRPQVQGSTAPHP